MDYRSGLRACEEETRQSVGSGQMSRRATQQQMSKSKMCKVHVCGHLHFNYGVSWLGPTLMADALARPSALYRGVLRCICIGIDGS